MKNDKRGAPLDSLNAHLVLGSRLADVFVSAAITGQEMSGRGVLWVSCIAESLAWTYKPQDECSDDIHDWVELGSLLRDYDLEKEVIVAWVDGAPEFFRLPMAQRKSR